MTTYKRIDNAFQVVEKWITYIAWFVLLAVMLMIVVDVTLRSGFKHPLPASWEISEVLMPFVIFLPFAYTLRLGAHVRVTLLTSRLSRNGQLACAIFSYAVSFVIAAMLTYWSFLRFMDSYAINERILAAIDIPWWPGKAMMPVGIGALAIRYLLLLVGAVWFKDTGVMGEGADEPVVVDACDVNVMAAG